MHRYAGRLTRGIAATMLGWSFCTTQGRTQEQSVAAMQTADAAFSAIRSMWSTELYPTATDYDVRVITLSHGATRTEAYAAHARPRTGDFRVSSISDAEIANPSVPHGFDITYSLGFGINTNAGAIGSVQGKQVSLSGKIGAAPVSEIYAVPEVSPLYSFGLIGCRRNVRSTIEGDLPLIGTVRRETKIYDIQEVGLETVRGTSTIHLALTPLVDPLRNRLRDIWFEPTSYRIVQARIAGNFLGRAESQIPWLIEFTTIAGATYIERESAEASLTRGRQTFDHIEIRFENVRPSGPHADLAFVLPQNDAGLNAVVEPPDQGRRSCSRSDR